MAHDANGEHHDHGREARSDLRSQSREARSDLRSQSREARSDLRSQSREARSRLRSQSRDTRSELRELALQLFAEQGYEKTSLREIAERLGVTKAALYYYFKSKEEIVHSLVEDYVADLDELIAWGKGQPRTAAVRAEIVRRYLGIVAGGAEVFRMLQQNQAAVAGLASAKEHGGVFRERMDAIIDLLTEPGATLREQVRAASSLMTISYCSLRYQDRAGREELDQAIIDVALELVDASSADASA